MSELKITIDQLKNYLGTGLKVYQEPITRELIGLKNDFPLLKDFGTSRSDLIKPICYRLSDLDKFIPELGFVPLQELFGYVEPDSKRIQRGVDLMNWPLISQFGIIQKLFQWHFWLFGDEYFESGLVIDKLKMTKK